jgi:hypothetical protein
MLDLSGLQLRYEPYPIGIAKNVFDKALYDQLIATYPTTQQFKYMPGLGRKYSLSEVNNHTQYRHFLATNPIWKEFHDWVKSRDFLRKVFKALDDGGVPLGLNHYANDRYRQRQKGKYLEYQSLAGLLSYLSARFEFSAMPADGGAILPHTDAPNKLVTLVVSMCGYDEWSPSFRGGTAIVRPNDAKKYFNVQNRYLGFDEVETLATWEFEPNQCILFVKTFNSWHAVNPMPGPQSLLRKTLTINIERKWLVRMR